MIGSGSWTPRRTSVRDSEIRFGKDVVEGTYRVWEYEPVLEEPCPLELNFDPPIVCCPVDCTRGLAKAHQRALNLHVCIRTVADWGVLQELCEQERVFADALDRLEMSLDLVAANIHHSGPLRGQHTFTSKSPMVRDFFKSHSSRLLAEPREEASVSRPF